MKVVLIERERGCVRRFGLLAAHVDPATVAELDPLFLFELAVAGTDRVGMKTEAPRQFSGAGQALPRSQVVAEDPQDDLRHQLFADGDFTSTANQSCMQPYLKRPRG